MAALGLRHVLPLRRAGATLCGAWLLIAGASLVAGHRLGVCSLNACPAACRLFPARD